MPVVSSLNIYPVKSCRGHVVERASLDAFGFVGDRRFLVVDDRGQFLTQRVVPRLALINVDVRGERIAFSAPDVEPIEVPTNRAGAESIEVTVWRDIVRATDLGGAVASWLTVFLEQPARLVTMAPDFARKKTLSTTATEFQASFQDAFPLLIIGEESLAELNSRLDQPLPMNRFRPNIVVRGAAAFDEDRWQRIRIGECELRAAGPCGRCVVTTTDQETLERGKEPLRTLALYRRDDRGEVNFGQNFVNETKCGDIAVGMPVQILE